jgi:uncharacterized integral membrane protein
MRYLNWIIRILLFIALLGLAIKNNQPVTLSYYFGFEWQSYLVVVLLIFFSVGTAIGVLAMLSGQLRLRREIAALKRQIRAKNKLADADNDETQQLPE